MSDEGRDAKYASLKRRAKQFDAKQSPTRCNGPTMKFTATNTGEQIDLQALHRVRERLVNQRNGILAGVNAARTAKSTTAGPDRTR